MYSSTTLIEHTVLHKPRVMNFEVVRLALSNNCTVVKIFRVINFRRMLASTKYF